MSIHLIYTHLGTCFYFACSDCWFWGYVVIRSDGVSSSREYCEVFTRSRRARQGIVAVSCFYCLLCGLFGGRWLKLVIHLCLRNESCYTYPKIKKRELLYDWYVIGLSCSFNLFSLHYKAWPYSIYTTETHKKHTSLLAFLLDVEITRIAEVEHMLSWSRPLNWIWRSYNYLWNQPTKPSLTAL